MLTYHPQFAEPGVEPSPAPPTEFARLPWEQLLAYASARLPAPPLLGFISSESAENDRGMRAFEEQGGKRSEANGL